MNCQISIDRLDWSYTSDQLSQEGYAVLPSFMSPAQCRKLASLYDNTAVNYRSIINMARYSFGQGQYKYFAYPLPEDVRSLRETFYSSLTGIANEWSSQLGREQRWPSALSEFTKQCQAVGQCRPTPLILRYGEGDYNCLHQDLYGECYFPFQVIFLLSAPGEDFEGGELVLTEQRPRMQSRPVVVPLKQGDAVILPVREIPRQGKKGMYRSQMRHGVSRVRSGERIAFGLIFHDAK